MEHMEQKNLDFLYRLFTSWDLEQYPIFVMTQKGLSLMMVC